MPLSEFYRTARGTLESGQEKTTTHLTDLSHVCDDEFVELVWENGQIMMQSRSNRARRSLTSNNFQSQSVKLRDKDLGCGSVLIDFTTSGEVGLGQDDDMVPWLNYPIDDSLQHDYCSEFLPEFSGVTVNELSEHSSFSSIDKKSSDNQKTRGSHSVSVHTGSSLEQANSKVSTLVVGESSGSRNSQLYPLSVLECQRSRPSLRSGVSGVTNSTDNTPRGVSGDSFQVHGPAGVLPSIKIQKPDSGIHNSDPRFTSSSRFSRTAAHRADIQSVGAMATPGSWGVGEMGDKNKGTFPRRSNLAESTPDDLRGFLRKEMGSLEQLILVPPKADSGPGVLKPVEELHTAEQSAAISEENVVKNDIMPNQVLDSSAPKGTPDCGKTIEPVVALSSVCSGNSAERASNDPTLDLKRKVRETSDYSEGRSEDVEEESIGVRKAAPARGGTGSKRSRAAEVHNLSERRRRDRINEKMRALQELIPNCNKVDKASMLDEAIEYLKTLQLQVQFMSMGAGLYMPPMMFPTGIQHLHSAHMARFSPMAVGMGMGLGYGMGMLDMNGVSAGCPVIQVPPMQGAHFPVPPPRPISGPTNFQGMATAGSNLQVLGHPSQGLLPVSAPIANLATLSGGPPLDSAMGHVK